jgi:transposase
VSLATLLLPGPSSLRLNQITSRADHILIDLTALQQTAPCPRCAAPSAKIHAYYQRRAADLPWAGVPVQLLLRVRRFVCTVGTCSRRTFCEPLPEVITPAARRSLRLANEQRQLGLQAGGNGASRIAHRQGMPVSPATILRLLRTTPLPEPTTPARLGVDEWAFRKGQDFKTMLVDLDTNRPLELLEDANAATLAGWLKDHPGVELIARDRAGSFAEGASQGAPNAVQVADRFHLVKNLRDALELILNRMVAARQAAAQALAEQPDPVLTSPGAADVGTQKPSVPVSSDLVGRVWAPYRQQLQAARRGQRLARYEQVLALHAEGTSMQEIARLMRMSRGTVKRYLLAGSFPERAPYPKLPSKLDPYLPYLEQRWTEGETNGTRLLEELRAKGFSGSPMTVKRWAQRYQQLVAPSATVKGTALRKLLAVEEVPPPAPVKSRRLIWWLLREPERLAEERADVLERMQAAEQSFGSLYRLAVDFTQMVRKRQPERLRSWLDAAKASEFPELRSLATGMERDYAAVEAGLRLPYSTGPVEGNINRLKLIKRSGYGRAGFDLLRIRVLAG